MNEIGDSADFKAVLAGKLDEIGEPGHGAIGLEDFANDRCRCQPCQRSEVAAGFRVPGAHQHPAPHSLNRKNMARLNEVGGPGIARHGHLNGAGTVSRGNACIDAISGFNGHGEIGAEPCTVAACHERQIKLTTALFGERETDQTTRMGDHEVDGFGRDEFGRHDEIALVFAVFFVNQYDKATGTQFSDNFGNRGNGRSSGMRHGISALQARPL